MTEMTTSTMIRTAPCSRSSFRSGLLLMRSTVHQKIWKPAPGAGPVVIATAELPAASFNVDAGAKMKVPGPPGFVAAQFAVQVPTVRVKTVLPALAAKAAPNAVVLLLFMYKLLPI